MVTYKCILLFCGVKFHNPITFQHCDSYYKVQTAKVSYLIITKIKTTRLYHISHDWARYS